MEFPLFPFLMEKRSFFQQKYFDVIRKVFIFAASIGKIRTLSPAKIFF